MKSKDITWYGKNKCTQSGRTSGNLDVTITKSDVNGQSRARFTFRNGVAKIISETEYLQFGVSKLKSYPRVYFMTGTSGNGLKLSCAGKPSSDNRYVNINKELDSANLLPFVGDYELLYDSECELYYIQK